MADGVEQLLRRHGVQVTAQRLAIMRAVSARPHATADELAEDVRAVIGSISRQAVYDTLGVLVDKRRIRRIQPAGSAARYEDRVGDNRRWVESGGWLPAGVARPSRRIRAWRSRSCSGVCRVGTCA